MAKLTVVPTPVGNLEDMTFRAIRVLKEADLILAEDTRTTGILLKHFEIQNKMQSHSPSFSVRTAKYQYPGKSPNYTRKPYEAP